MENEIVEAIKSEDDVESVVSALGNIERCLSDSNEGGNITWIAESLSRIADAIERISHPPAKG